LNADPSIEENDTEKELNRFGLIFTKINDQLIQFVENLLKSITNKKITLTQSGILLETLIRIGKKTH
jgi:hypothetical protein